MSQGQFDTSAPDAAPAANPSAPAAETDRLAMLVAVTAVVLSVDIALAALARNLFPAIPAWLVVPFGLLTLPLALAIARRLAHRQEAALSTGEIRQEARRLMAQALAKQSFASASPQAEALDALTGCATRDALPGLLTELRAHGEALALLRIDIDNVAHVNEFHGEQAGNSVLAECARRITALLPPGAEMARLGGDEFAVLLALPDGLDASADQLAADIIARIATVGAADGMHGGINANIGLVRAPAQAQLPIEVLLRRADIALYQARKQGVGRSRWFEPAMEDALRHHCEIETGLAEGLAHGEFVPWFQPVVDLSSGALVGFEMLARWQSPRFGLLAPDVFIPIAEESGAIAELFDKLLLQAMAEARGWPGELMLTVNVSPVQVRDPWFSQKLLKLIHAEGFPRQRLEVEISETCLHGDITGVTTLATSLKNQGISLCMDDFGMGYSSLAQLRRLDFDRIKLHRGLVSGFEHDADSRAIVDSVVLLGRGLSLPITVEGVDSPSLLESLRQLGDFRAQGFAIGEPRPAGETRAVIAASRIMPPAERAAAPERRHRA